jgi:hypothetical protein
MTTAYADLHQILSSSISYFFIYSSKLSSHHKIHDRRNKKSKARRHFGVSHAKAPTHHRYELPLTVIQVIPQE